MNGCSSIDVHAPRRLEEAGVEGAQALADGVQLDAQAEGHAAANMAFCTLCMALPSSVAGIRCVHIKRDVAALVVEGDHLAVDAGFQRAGAAAGADVLAHHGVIADSSSRSR